MNNLGETSDFEEGVIEEEVVCSHVSKEKLTKTMIANYHQYLRLSEAKINEQNDDYGEVFAKVFLPHFEYYHSIGFKIQTKKSSLYELVIVKNEGLNQFFILRHKPSIKNFILNKEPSPFRLDSWINNRYWIAIFRDAIDDKYHSLLVLDLESGEITSKSMNQEFISEITKVFDYENGYFSFCRFRFYEGDLKYLFSIVDLSSNSLHLAIEPPKASTLDYINGNFYWVESKMFDLGDAPYIGKFDPKTGKSKEFYLKVALGLPNRFFSSTSRLGKYLVDFIHEDSYARRQSIQNGRIFHVQLNSWHGHFIFSHRFKIQLRLLSFWIPFSFFKRKRF